MNDLNGLAELRECQGFDVGWKTRMSRSVLKNAFFHGAVVDLRWGNG